MKKLILFISFFMGVTSFSFAQDDDRSSQWEQIKALKVAYFTQEMNFSDKVAAKFWPIYNKYESDRRKLHEREHIEIDNVDCITEDDANALLSEFLSVENEEYKIKKQLFHDLKGFMTAKEILKIHKLEDEFHKKLFKEYWSKKDRKDSNSSE